MEAKITAKKEAVPTTPAHQSTTVVLSELELSSEWRNLGAKSATVKARRAAAARNEAAAS
ncbi:hypothetical protein [Trinickia fusca]|uniref:hypothetical protein n=1 Tax=Trinickia fusca TaxID=2419777 RepID=UPI0011C3FDE7|nr:hypothetical protein [Trinickia fusca]